MKFGPMQVKVCQQQGRQKQLSMSIETQREQQLTWRHSVSRITIDTVATWKPVRLYCMSAQCSLHINSAVSPTFLQGYIDTLITQPHTIYLSSALMNKAGLPQGRLTGKRGSMCGATSHVGTRQAGGVRVQSISRPPERASGRIPGTGGLLTQALERQNTGMITGAGSAAEVVIGGVTLHLGGTAAEHSMHTAAAETIAPRVATGGRMSLTGDLRRRSVLGR